MSWLLFTKLKEKLCISAFGCCATDKSVFSRYCDMYKDVLAAESIIGDWMLDERSNLSKSQIFEHLKRIQRDYPDFIVWDAIISDRRFIFPIKSQLLQNYSSRFSHYELIRKAVVAFILVEEQVKNLNPNFVFGQTPVTLFDQIYIAICKKENIPIYHLSLTRIANYIYFTSNFNGYGKEFSDRFSLFYTNGIDQDLIKTVKKVVSSSRLGELQYEGGLSDEVKYKIADQSTTNNTFFRPAVEVLKEISRKNFWWFGIRREVRYHPNKFERLFYGVFFRRFRTSCQKKFFKEVIDFDSSYRYALFALNTEPEIALLNFGKNFRNQIESIRLISSNLPLDFKLIVKEHPLAIGYRSAGFYRAIQQFPNVILVGGGLSPGYLIKNCDLVFSIYGTIGLEAIFKRKPLFCFSKSPYGIFPSSMVRVISDINKFKFEIVAFLEEYSYCEKSTEAYVGALLSLSCPVNFYSEILGKGKTGGEFCGDLEEQYSRLTSYFLKRLQEDGHL